MKRRDRWEKNDNRGIIAKKGEPCRWAKRVSVQKETVTVENVKIQAETEKQEIKARPNSETH